jgi:15-cis-phytoene synthase
MRPVLDETYVRRARAPGSARDFALLFSPQRATLTALLALQAEIQSVARLPLDHGVAHSRMEWWRGELARLEQGKPVHPVTRVLHEAARSQPVDFSPLAGLVVATEWELARLAVETPAEFEAACWRSHGVVQWIGMQLVGTPADLAQGFARELGAGLGLERALLTLDRVARRGFIPLPLSGLNARNITIEDLREARPPPALAGYVAALCADARLRLHRVRSELPAPLRSALRAHIVLAGLCEAQLASIEKAARSARDFHQEISTLQRLWTAWRAARRS